MAQSWAFHTAWNGRGPSGDGQWTFGDCPVWCGQPPPPHEERIEGQAGQGAGPVMMVVGTALPSTGSLGCDVRSGCGWTVAELASREEGLSSDGRERGCSSPSRGRWQSTEPAESPEAGTCPARHSGLHVPQREPAPGMPGTGDREEEQRT